MSSYFLSGQVLLCKCKANSKVFVIYVYTKMRVGSELWHQIGRTQRKYSDRSNSQYSSACMHFVVIVRRVARHHESHLSKNR
jgi:hypothetical protein